jgi:Bifunctional DNA primase/polymerase, N-terminal
MIQDPRDAAYEARQALLAHGAQCREAALIYLQQHHLSAICLCHPTHEAVGKAHAKSCTKPGKVPMGTWKDTQAYLPTAEALTAAWERYPYGNVGVVLGEVSGLVRIDVDGERGQMFLAEASQGDLPPTWQYRSPGSPAMQYLYAWPRNIRCKTARLQGNGTHQELRFQGNGAQAVLPPSAHISGGVYTWVPGHSPEEHPLAKAPTWLVARLHRPPLQHQTLRSLSLISLCRSVPGSGIAETTRLRSQSRTGIPCSAL